MYYSQTSHKCLEKLRPTYMLEKSLIKTVGKLSELSQIAHVASAVVSFRFPRDYMVGHISRSLHAGYEATGTSATIPNLFNNVFHCLPLEGCGSLINSC